MPRVARTPPPSCRDMQRTVVRNPTMQQTTFTSPLHCCVLARSLCLFWATKGWRRRRLSPMGSSSCRRTWPCAIWARFRCRSVQPLRSPPSFVMLWRMIRLPCCRLRAYLVCVCLRVRLPRGCFLSRLAQTIVDAVLTGSDTDPLNASNPSAAVLAGVLVVGDEMPFLPSLFFAPYARYV